MPLIGQDENGVKLIKPHPADFAGLDHKITAITLGAGSRGNVYGNYSLEYPDNLDIVGVAEPIPIRNERYSKKHNIGDSNRFDTWEHVFERPKFADAIIITCLLYTSPSPRDQRGSRMPSSA